MSKTEYVCFYGNETLLCTACCPSADQCDARRATAYEGDGDNPFKAYLKNSIIVKRPKDNCQRYIKETQTPHSGAQLLRHSIWELLCKQNNQKGNDSAAEDKQRCSDARTAAKEWARKNSASLQMNSMSNKDFLTAAESIESGSAEGKALCSELLDSSTQELLQQQEELHSRTQDLLKQRFELVTKTASSELEDAEWLLHHLFINYPNSGLLEAAEKWSKASPKTVPA